MQAQVATSSPGMGTKVDNFLLKNRKIIAIVAVILVALIIYWVVRNKFSKKDGDKKDTKKDTKKKSDSSGGDSSEKTDPKDSQIVDLAKAVNDKFN